MQCSEQHHLLLSAVDALVQELPLGLLVDQVDPHCVVLEVEVVERVVLKPQQEDVELSDALLHDGERGVEPADVHAGALDQCARVQLERAHLGARHDAVRQVGEVAFGRQDAVVEAAGGCVAVAVRRVVSVA